ncbi:Protein of unknown function [Salinibacillus kushneri]|uniref:DUF3231 family protein n=1 Tax=Salinibacillus kushneri TaxID=237682 RepID=A0A1I0FAF6_9BACI|nr:DUF3231 family protein [Salinibacillus kushneri]SET54915.1 Protein of unknown function [Salinibacillus kushneri]
MMKKTQTNQQLTPAEMGKMWATYMGNTMAICVLKFYLRHVEDSDIKKVLEHALNLSEHIVKEMEKFFNESNFPVPKGFTEDDVNLEAPRLFEDIFYLYYLQYTGKAGLSLYNTGIPLMTRTDIRDFYIHTLDLTLKLTSDVNDVLRKKGLLMNPPESIPPKQVNFVNSQSFLNGIFGNVRTLHGLEVAHLYDNMNNDATSKALIIAFSQVAKRERVRKYLIRGRKINERHLDTYKKKLENDQIPAAKTLDHLVTNSTISPFSDKLMLYHKIDMFSMKIRTFANGASLNGRRDIGGMYAKFLLDVSLFVEDGANIMIDHGWMEKPPEAHYTNF